MTGNGKFFWIQCKNFPLPRNIKSTKRFHSVMTSMTIFTQVRIHPTLYGFSQYRSYTDFDSKLDGFWLGLLTNCKVKKVKQILICSKHGHWRHNRVKSFLFLGFLGNSNFQVKFFALYYHSWLGISALKIFRLGFLDPFVTGWQCGSVVFHYWNHHKSVNFIIQLLSNNLSIVSAFRPFNGHG